MEQPLPAKVQRLLQDLQAKEPYLRKTAAEELGKWNTSDRRVLNALNAVLAGDDNKYVRAAAAQTYSALTGRQPGQEIDGPPLEKAIVHVNAVQPSMSLVETIRGRQGLILAIVALLIGLWLLAVFLRPAINTPAGQLLITKARLADSVPPGCTSPSYTCVTAEPGYRILILRMKSGSGENVETLSNGIPKEVYVVSENGSQTKWFQQQMNISPPWVSLAFAVKESERDFKIVWPNQPPVALNPILYFMP